MTELDNFGELPARPEILSSWRRSFSSGLSPYTRFDSGNVQPFDEASRLLRAASPVLDSLTTALDGSRYTLILADQDAVLVDIRYGSENLRPVLDDVGTVVGRRFDEAAAGTNSIATALELRRGVFVHGPEHYLESFRRFACYGLPIQDPATRRTVGVLDISCAEEQDASPLLRPFLVQAVKDIEGRLLGGTQRSHRKIVEAFDSASLRTSGALVGFGRDLILTNSLAAEALQPTDQAALHAMALEMSRTGHRGWRRDFDLASGEHIGLEGAVVDGGVLVHLQHMTRNSPIRRRRNTLEDNWIAVSDRELAVLRAAGTSVLVRGEAGTGRRTVARRLTHKPIQQDEVSDEIAQLDGSTVNVAEIRLLPSHVKTIAITDVELLDSIAASVLNRRVTREGLRLILTTTAAALDGQVATLAAHCPVRLDLPSLRSRRDRIPTLAAEMLRQRSAQLRFTPGALRALAAQDWPGNLRELRSVVDYVADSRTVGDVTEAYLPAGYRSSRRTPNGSLEQAERDAVIEALQRSGGNKVQAAEILGISRTTLYSYIRSMRIDVGTRSVNGTPKPS